MHNQRGLILFLTLALIAIAISGGIYFITSQNSSDSDINSFEKCAAAGYPIMESYPRQCAVPGRGSFTEMIATDNDPASCAAVLCMVGSTCVGGQCIPAQEVILPADNKCMTVRCMAGYYCEPTTGQCVREEQPAAYYCAAPSCTGMAPSSDVVRDCANIQTESACKAYQSANFPHQCEWGSHNVPCPPYP